jgi:ABC-type nitrate/sulfonate/bicarbonate transport system substrate-binding protein
MTAPTPLDTLWYTRCSVPTPLSFAAQFGWIDAEFKPDGIAIKSLRESNDPAEQASHYDHNLPDSFRQGGSIPPIWARANGVDTRVIGLSWTDEFQAIIALPSSGIRTVRDLAGRRFGLPLHETRIDHNRASALRALLVALDIDGVPASQVERVDLADAAYPVDAAAGEAGSEFSQARRKRHTYANEVYALARGDVDAVYVKDVRGLEVAKLLGAHIVVDLGFHADPFVRISNCTPRPLTVNAATIERHPDIVARFLRRVTEAAAWARNHPDDTVSYIARETGWSERLVRQSFGPDVHKHFDIDLSQDKIDGINTLKDFLFEHGFLTTDFNTADWIDTRPLDALNDALNATGAARLAA